MKMSINDALDELDTENDAHWTADGDPKLDAVSELMGVKVTRKEVKDAAPHFRRDNPELASIIETEGETDAGNEEAQGEEGREEVLTAPEATGGHAEVAGADPATEDAPEATGYTPTDEELAEAEAKKPESQRLDEAAQRVQLQIDKLIKERNYLHAMASQAHTRESRDADKHQGTRDRMTYIQRQNELRRERVAERQKMAEMIGLQGAIAHAPSVLDAALANRKPQRGATRPDHTPQAADRLGKTPGANPNAPSPVLGRGVGANPSR